jgi:Tfp pilus assembly protein PilF
MKIHTKKKAYRLACKLAARDGRINNPQGQWVNRSSVPDTSMKRDYSPQSGK